MFREFTGIRALDRTLITETLALVRSEGVELAKLDKLMTKWGLLVGPITLADEVGLDVAYPVN
ncbi:hypothetical protein PsorP6_018428 [Peronosclerospora sorghi]|nr:hypothetical protein PsorP6_018434 [Peronosclerospora sorghi]KAI9895533.1 hypothetical protein PsorP6_018428 [Peronosclerospora sorghi]